MAKPKLTPADEKFIAKFFPNLNFDATEVHVRKNPYSGFSAELDPICAAAYDFAVKLEKVINYSRNEAELKAIHPELRFTNAVSNFDRARYLVMKLNPRAYSTLLD
jgi:hypothetical protein